MADGDYKTEKADGGYILSKGGQALVFLRGEEGSLTAEPIEGGPTRDAQSCFDECFAASSGTTGAAHSCAMKCGLT